MQLYFYGNISLFNPGQNIQCIKNHRSHKSKLEHVGRKQSVNSLNAGSRADNGHW